MIPISIHSRLGHQHVRSLDLGGRSLDYGHDDYEGDDRDCGWGCVHSQIFDGSRIVAGCALVEDKAREHKDLDCGGRTHIRLEEDSLALDRLRIAEGEGVVGNLHTDHPAAELVDVHLGKVSIRPRGWSHRRGSLKVCPLSCSTQTDLE